MKTIRLSLFWKFTFAIVLIVTGFGYLTMYMVDREVNTLIEEEFDSRGRSIANVIAGQTARLVVQADKNELTRLTENIVPHDSTIAFLAILDTAEDRPVALYLSPLVSTADFEKMANLEAGGGTPVRFQTSANHDVRNFIGPVDGAGRWSVQVGLVEHGVVKKRLLVKKKFVAMVLVFLALGIVGAFVFSYTITQPLKNIGEQARALSLGSLGGTAQMEVSRGRLLPWGEHFKMKDEIDALVGQFNDMIRRLSLAHREVREAQNALIHAEKMSAIGTLVAGLCHSINNPIAGLKNCINRISKAPENVEQNKKYLPIMAEAVKHAENILNELLAFSRKEEVGYESFDIRQPVEKVISVLSCTLEDYRIAFTKKYPKNLPEVYGNLSQMEQVILNLVKNSIDAIDARQAMGHDDDMGEITFQLDADQERLKLDISDNGIGVEADKLQRIFDPFFTTKKKNKGTGLGLLVSYNIIKAHGGKIFASKNDGLGLTFTILLPLHISQKSNSPT